MSWLTKKEEETFHRVLAANGLEVQKDALIKEMAELTKAIVRGRHSEDPESPANMRSMIRQIATVQILLDQLILFYEYYGCLYSYFRDKQVSRLKKRLDREEK